MLCDFSSRHFIAVKLALITAAAMFLAGCPVTQKPGKGVQFTITEAQTSRKGYLYIPAGYDSSKRWPVVLTFHAYKPFDSAQRQMKEWGSTADKYGLIVLAPILVNAGPQMGYKLNRITPSVQKDVQATMGMLDYVLTHTAADPDRVYITGFSYGGFLMHYITNLFPERFAALCSRNCGFNSNILNEDTARRMAEKNFPIMIYYTQYDMWYIKADSKNAIRWYKEMGFNVESRIIPQGIVLPLWAHFEGRPEIAAEFFLRSTGLNGRLRIIASPQTGTAPLAVNLSVQLPHYVDSDRLEYLWTLDGELLAQTPQTSTTISESGAYDIKVIVTENGGKAFTANQEVIVGPPGI